MEIDRNARLGERVRCSMNSEESYWALVPRPLPPLALQLDDLQSLVGRFHKPNARFARLLGSLSPYYALSASVSKIKPDTESLLMNVSSPSIN